MAYSTGAPPACVVRSTDGSSPSIWHYRSTDSIDTVAGSGYISNATNLGMRLGDIVYVVESDSGYVLATMVVAGITSGAATLTDNTGRQLTAGAGITAGTGTVHESGVTRAGGIITTRLLIDLTGLNSGGTAGDIIGVNGAGAAYIGQITAAVTGSIFAGSMVCLEAPAGGDADFDLYSATEATGVEDTAITALAETQLINAGTQSLGTTTYLAAMPAANEYLYLVNQGTGNATYTAGKFLITIYGI